MVVLNKIYTKTGDAGETALGFTDRRSRPVLATVRSCRANLNNDDR